MEKADSVFIVSHEKTISKQGIPFALFVMLALGLLGGGRIWLAEEKLSRKRVVVATTGMIADVVKNILGEDSDIEVLTIIRPSLDPHSYSCTLGDASKLMKADLIFANGLHLEGPLANTLRKLSVQRGEGKVFFARDALESSDIIGHDPHIWFDVALWSKVATYIGKVLQEKALTQEEKDKYKKNTRCYIERLEELDKEIRKQINFIPEDKRILCTSHDAFAYWAKRYGFQVIAPQGISTVEEPSLGSKQEVINTIIKENIKVIFPEHSTNNKVLQAIQEACQSQGHQVTFSTLYTDALGGAGSGAETYCSMILCNLEVIQKALPKK